MPPAYKLIKLLLLFGIVAGLLLSPALVLADGYSPLDLPERGQGPKGSVQSEQVEKGEASSSASPHPTEDEIVGTFTGTVQAVEDNRLTVEVNGDEREVEVPKGVGIMRDGQPVNLSEITQGDSVTIERNDEGIVTEVRVASKQSMDFWRTFLPILVVVLVAFFLLSRNRSPRKA